MLIETVLKMLLNLFLMGFLTVYPSGSQPFLGCDTL